MTEKERFNELIQRDNTASADLERKSFFNIMAKANDGDLYKKIDYIYDFEDNCIKLECLEGATIDLCSSAIRMIRLSFNLFNGYSDDCDVLSILGGLDDRNFQIALESIHIRFNREMQRYGPNEQWWSEQDKIYDEVGGNENEKK